VGLQHVSTIVEVDETVNDDPSIQPNTDRVNGFAPGDRVAIVNCELAGAYGKVTKSRGGCWDDCRDHCRLVYVDVMHKPEDVEVSWYRQSYDGPSIMRFEASEVVHVD
jgi:hypothetical protein